MLGVGNVATSSLVSLSTLSAKKFQNENIYENVTKVCVSDQKIPRVISRMTYTETAASDPPRNY